MFKTIFCFLLVKIFFFFFIKAKKEKVFTILNHLILIKLNHAANKISLFIWKRTKLKIFFVFFFVWKVFIFHSFVKIKYKFGFLIISSSRHTTIYFLTKKPNIWKFCQNLEISNSYLLIYFSLTIQNTKKFKKKKKNSILIK